MVNTLPFARGEGAPSSSVYATSDGLWTLRGTFVTGISRSGDVSALIFDRPHLIAGGCDRPIDEVAESL